MVVRQVRGLGDRCGVGGWGMLGKGYQLLVIRQRSAMQHDYYS